jgi:putative ABC transport system ATP-binding protein
VQIKYEQVVEQFQPDGMLPPEAQDMTVDASQPLAGDIVAANLVVVDEGDRKLLDGVAFSVKSSEHIAIAGEGRETLAMALAGLIRPSAGSLTVGGRDISDLPEAITGRHIAYVASESYLFPNSVRENLTYGLKHRPLRDAVQDDAVRRKRQLAILEATRSGNPALDPAADWSTTRRRGPPTPRISCASCWTSSRSSSLTAMSINSVCAAPSILPCARIWRLKY